MIHQVCMNCKGKTDLPGVGFEDEVGVAHGWRISNRQLLPSYMPLCMTGVFLFVSVRFLL